MRKILCAISQDTSLYVLVSHKFRHPPIVRQASRVQVVRSSGPASFRHVLPMVLWKGCHGAARAIYSRLALCRSCEFDFWPKARVQFSCLQSRLCLPMTWRRDAGIFSINNARDLKLPKRRRFGTRRAMRINRSFDRCLVWFSKKISYSYSKIFI